MAAIGSARAVRVAEWANLSLQQPLTYEVIIPPATTPVTLEQVKTQLRITNTNDDVYLQLLIESVTQFFEKYTNRILINTGFRTFFAFFTEAIELRRAKLQTIDNFFYLVEGAQTVVDPTSFYTTSESDYSRIIFNTFNSMPQNKDDRFQSVIVEFTAGFGIDDTFIPADIKIALLQHITALYENRGDCGDSACPGDCSTEGLPAPTRSVYNRYRVGQLTQNLYRGGGLV